MENRKIRVAITHGDINGVGYEVIFKALEDPTMLELCTPIIYGSPKVATYHAKALGIEMQFNIINKAEDAKDGHLNMVAVTNEEIKVDLGENTPEGSAAAMLVLNRALDDYKQGLYDVLVTAPVFKNSIQNFNGHNAYIEKYLGEGRGLTILKNEDLHVALVTNNVAVKDVSEAITKQKIVEKAKIFFQCLKRDLRISNPRIAVMALNPRCGEEGLLGDEELTTIIPAIKELVEQGVQVFGPYAADDFFGTCSYYRFDGILAMYHDQGQTPFKALATENGVRLTTGLPLVRTAPAHGVFYNLAGRNQADASSFRQAIYTAIDVWRNRQDYDEPLANPLPKLYHEKRDESEKVRFNTPKKEFPKKQQTPAEE